MIFAFAAITAINPIFGGTPDPGALYYGGVYGAAPAVAALGAALPARALGSGWLRSLVVATLVVTAFFWIFFGLESERLVALAFALAPVVVTFAGSGNAITDEGIRAVLVAWAIFLLTAFLGNDDGAFGFIAVILHIHVGHPAHDRRALSTERPCSVS